MESCCAAARAYLKVGGERGSLFNQTEVTPAGEKTRNAKSRYQQARRGGKKVLCVVSFSIGQLHTRCGKGWRSTRRSQTCRPVHGLRKQREWNGDGAECLVGAQVVFLSLVVFARF